MASRRLQRKTRRNRRSSTWPIKLEMLDPRLLLNASSEWVDPDDLSDFIRDGFGVPDPFYSDPATWGIYADWPDVAGSDIIDLNDMLEGADKEVQGILSDSDDNEIDADVLDNPDGPEAAASAGGYVLYLDFDGDRVYSRSGDFWLGSSYIDIPAYDLGMFGWEGQEQESIDYITEYVRADYAAYNISVTTEEPSSGEYSTIYVGGNNDWFRPGSGVIGVATYDVGNRDASNFGFAFPEELSIYYNYSGGSLLRYSEYLANLITHEAGHTYGANHVSDVTATMNPYLAINPHRTMFGSNNIPGTSVVQDTQSMMGANLGYAHGADDYGDDYSHAITITESTSIEGMLQRRDDVDAFSFTAEAAGTVTIDIDTSVYGNLDSYLTIYSENGSRIIAENDDYDHMYDSLISFETEADETYTIYLSSYSGNSSGSYTLNIALADVEPMPEISVSDNSGSANDLTIDFGKVTIDTTNTAQITIGNNGTADLIISQLSANGSFALDLASSAGSGLDDITIEPGSEQVVTVTFNVGQIGSYDGTVTIVSNDADQQLVTLELSGLAHGPEPDMVLTSAGLNIAGGVLDFGGFERNDSNSEIITISNGGQNSLYIYDIEVAAPFSIDSGYNGSTLIIAPGDSVDVTIEVTGAVRGALSGELVIIGNDPDEPSTSVDLSAQVLGGVLTVQESAQVADDGRIDFGSVLAGDSGTETITLINTGDGTLTITGLGVDDPFSLDELLDVGNSGDDVILAPGESMVVTVSYQANALEIAEGEVSITTDNVESPTSEVELQALGVAGLLEISEVDGVDDGQTDAGQVQVGQEELVQVWQITNQGNIAVTVELTLDKGSDFQLVADNTIVLAAGESYIAKVQVNTDLARGVTDTLLLSANDLAETSQSLELTAEGYALIGGKDRYSFVDNNGDRVTISLSGTAQGRVSLGAGQNSPDIESIEILSSTGTEKLTIKVRGSGRTQLGQIIGAADLQKIAAKNVDLVGAGIELDGTLERLHLGSVLNGADISFSSGEPANIRLEEVIGSTEIDIDGALNQFRANNFLGGSLHSDSIGKIFVYGDLNAEVEANNGDLNKLIVKNGDLNGSVTSSGAIGKLAIANGDIFGDITAGDAINMIAAKNGVLGSEVRSGSTIKKINIDTMNDADIMAMKSIDRINIRRDMIDSLVSVGPDDTCQPQESADSRSSLEACLGAIKVKGTFTGSTVAVGVTADSEGNFINGIANADTGTIGSVWLGQVETENGQNPFGLVAKDAMTKLRINRQTVNDEYQDDDFFIKVLND